LTRPRLPSRFEFHVLRTACRLPPRLRRLLFGRPPTIDGQELAPDIHVVLKLDALTGAHSLTGGRRGERARAFNRRDVAASAGPPTPVAEVRELTIPGPGGPLPARLYIPHGAPPAPRPLLLYYPGGGWAIGGFYSHEGPCRFLAAHSGAAVLCAPYRLAPEHPFPAAVEDAQAIFEWTLASANDLDVDPSRIAVGGDSSGGNLATVASLLARNAGGPQPAMQLLIYPATDARGKQRSRELFATGFKLTQGDIEYFERSYLPDRLAATDPRVSVLEVDDLSGLPPAYVVTAGFDPLRDEGEEYAGRMREAGVRVALRRHPGLIHLFINLTAISRSSREAMVETAGALRMGLASASR
jgi:acetyl esterase